jgi:hypothetical protein
MSTYTSRLIARLSQIVAWVEYEAQYFVEMGSIVLAFLRQPNLLCCAFYAGWFPASSLGTRCAKRLLGETGSWSFQNRIPNLEIANQPNAAWASITSGSSGTGNGTVNYTIQTNAGAQRSGTLSISGQTFSITQSGVQAQPDIRTSPTTLKF